MARDHEAAADPDPTTPWDELVGGGEASFADVLRGLRPLFPSSLIDGEGWLRLLARVAELPAAAAAFFGFEFRLGDPDPSADVCVPLTSDVAAAAALEFPVALRFVREARSGAPLQPSRAALARCISEFGRADSVLASWAQGVLLEYDIAALPGGIRGTPGIFFALRKEPGGSGRDVQNAARRDIARTLANACGWSADPAEQREVERVFDALPSGARINQAGAMPDRAGRAIRLVAQGIDETEAPAFLARLRWPGPVATETEAPALLARDCDGPARLPPSATSWPVCTQSVPRSRFRSTSLHKGLGPRLGLEMYAKGGSGFQATTRRRLATVRGQTGGERLVHRVQGTGACWSGPDTRRCTATTRSSSPIRGSTT